MDSNLCKTLGRWEACALCRAKKKRCDGAQPACGVCTSLGRICRYEEKRRPRPPPSSAVLSAKLHDLQEKLQTMLASNDREPTSGDTLLFEPLSSLGSSSQLASPSSQLQLPNYGDIECSDADRDLVLAIFFKYQRYSVTQIDQWNFLSALSAENPASRPHLALIDAMMLCGIMFAGFVTPKELLPPDCPHSEVLLSRIHRELISSLEMADRLVDFLQASVLVIFWYFCKGRLQEGKYISSSSFRFAVACQLHRIEENVLQEHLNDDVVLSFWDCTVLGRPHNRYELCRRISIFWQLYGAESINSLLIGLPTACDEQILQSITTIWPHCLTDCEHGATMLPKHLKSTKDLFSGDMGNAPTILSFSHVVGWSCLGAKVTEMSALCSAIGGQSIERVGTLIETVQSYAFAIQSFASTCGLVDTPPGGSDEPWGTSTPTNFALMTVSCSTARIEVIRAAEQLTNMKTLQEGAAPNVEVDRLGILAPLSFSSETPFLDMKYVVAKASIETVHNIVIVHGCETANTRPSPATMVSQIPNCSGFMMTVPMLVIVDYIRHLKGQLKQKPENDTSIGELSGRLRGAESTLARGRDVMSLLSINLPILKLQIEKIEEAYCALVPSETTPP